MYVETILEKNTMIGQQTERRKLVKIDGYKNDCSGVYPKWKT